MSIKGVFLVVLVASLGSITSALNFSSPCPTQFHYDSADQPNQWSGTVKLLSDSDLHGIWVRLIFNEKLTELVVHDNLGQVVPSDDNREYLIKNRNFLLKAGAPTDVKITVKYEGDKIPTLTGYRLNAKMVCSSYNVNFGHFFSGDLNNKDFLASITSQPPSPAYKEFEGCGTAPLANPVGANKKAQNGQWPWQGAIYIQNNNVEKYVCGATLISPRHLLTPAHCVTYQRSELVIPVTQLSIYLGKHTYSKADTDKNVQKLQVEKVFVHPGYRAEQLLSDLAVIQLEKSAIVGDYVRPICLTQLEDSKSNEGYILGYGITGDKMEDLSQAKAAVLKEEECLDKKSDLKGLLVDDVLCTNYVEDTACVGDSGSSFVSIRDPQKPVWELKGIVSVGVALQDKYVCDRSSRVFVVDVANYLKWIQATIS